MRIEDTIISGLLLSEEYARKVVPHIDKEYFAERADALIYDELSTYFIKYNSLPTKEVLLLQVAEKSGISTSDTEDAYERIQAL